MCLLNNKKQILACICKRNLEQNLNFQTIILENRVEIHAIFSKNVSKGIPVLIVSANNC